MYLLDEVRDPSVAALFLYPTLTIGDLLDLVAAQLLADFLKLFSRYITRQLKCECFLSHNIYLLCYTSYYALTTSL